MNIKDPVTGLTMDELTYYGGRGTRTLQTLVRFHFHRWSPFLSDCVARRCSACGLVQELDIEQPFAKLVFKNKPNGNK